MAFRAFFLGVFFVISWAMLSAQSVCSLKTVDLGHGPEFVFRTLPCVWTPTSPVMGGSALTFIRSNPAGAQLVLGGVVIGTTPTTLILEQRGDRSKSFTLIVKKKGYRDTSVRVKDGDSFFAELSPEQSDATRNPMRLPAGRQPLKTYVNPVIQSRCSPREWTNAFQPDQPVFPKETDLCPADESKPLFTREGTLACGNPESMLYALSAMNHSWRSVGQLAGITDPRPSPPGQPVSAEYYGCAVYHDGTAINIGDQRSPLTSAIKTNIGWVFLENLRN